MKLRIGRWVGVVALATVVASCGNGQGQGEAGGGGEPQAGGVATFATFMPTGSLDPVVNSGYGVSGGIEMLAVYDSVMRWVPKEQKYEPRTAESLVSNDEFTEWTLKIKPGITFTDGTAYDAEAVKFSLDRHRVGSPTAPDCKEVRACPMQNTSTKGYMPLVKDVKQVDDLTLVITTEPWSGFPMVLAGEPGMVPSPTAVRKACPEKGLLTECEYGENPVGAGPFKVKAFRPGETVELVRNDDFYAGEVYLDGVKFITFQDGGGDKTIEAMKSGQVDVAFLRTPTSINTANEAKYDGYSAVQQMGRQLLVNTRPGAATSSLKVRQAVNAAIDRSQLNDRVYNGLGIISDDLFTDDYAFNPDVSFPGFDRKRAIELVKEAKADGWDGKIEIIAASAERPRLQALKAMLDAVGMDTEARELEYGQLIETVNVKEDFDMSLSGLPIGPDDSGIMAIITNLKSDSLRNRTGYKNEAMDAAVDELFTASTTDAKKAALAEVVAEFEIGQPWVVEGAVEERVVWGPKVHGVYPNQTTEVYLDKAWMN